MEDIFGKRPWISRSEEIFEQKEENNKNEIEELKPVGSKENVFIHTKDKVENKSEETDEINKEKE